MLARILSASAGGGCRPKFRWETHLLMTDSVDTTYRVSIMLFTFRLNIMLGIYTEVHLSLGTLFMFDTHLQVMLNYVRLGYQMWFPPPKTPLFPMPPLPSMPVGVGGWKRGVSLKRKKHHRV